MGIPEKNSDKKKKKFKKLMKKRSLV